MKAQIVLTVNESKRLIAKAIIGLLANVLLGEILAPAIAVEYNYQLDDITGFLSKISKSVSNIENRVN